MVDGWRDRAVSAAEAIRLIRPGQHIYVHGDCAASLPLEAALAAIAPTTSNLTVVQVHKDGPEVLAAPDLAPHVRIKSLFSGAGVRQAIAEGRADYVPINLSDIPGAIRTGLIPVDVAIVQLSPPDHAGWCSLGVSVDSARQAVETAHVVMAEINDQMPRTLGQGFVHLDSLDAYIVTDRPLLTRVARPGTPEVAAIGRHVASLVQDGATLQLGIGMIPDAVLAALHDKSDLGLHTEMFSDRVVELVRQGVITNARKTLHRGCSIVAFVAGTRVTYDFIDANDSVAFYPTDYTNDQAIIRQQYRMTSINACMQVDLTGQVCSDSIGSEVYSGVGGQVDFVRGASLAPEGRSILAMPATAKGGAISRIVPVLSEGAGVVTPRAHVQYIVTEFGVADLRAQSLRTRAERLIAIAHPDHREALRHAAVSRRFFAL